MYYTGIDLHKKTSYITTIDENGKIVSKNNFKNIESDILEYFESLTEDMVNTNRCLAMNPNNPIHVALASPDQ